MAKIKDWSITGPPRGELFVSEGGNSILVKDGGEDVAVIREGGAGGSNIIIAGAGFSVIIDEANRTLTIRPN